MIHSCNLKFVILLHLYESKNEKMNYLLNSVCHHPKENGFSKIIYTNKKVLINFITFWFYLIFLIQTSKNLK